MGTYLSIAKQSQLQELQSWPDAIITTGQPVNLQIPADRNPTAWSATGLASGLAINNSGVLSGSASSLSPFTASFTASNSDGNDTKSMSFGVLKGNRVITWDQTFAGLTYGDNPVSFTGTATGPGDFNYTSSDTNIIEINGTSAIIRGGGTVTVTATAWKTPIPLQPSQWPKTFLSPRLRLP